MDEPQNLLLRLKRIAKDLSRSPKLGLT